MNHIRKQLIVISVFAWILSACTPNNNAVDEQRGFETYKENDGGSFGLLIADENLLVTFNFFRFSIFDRNGKFERQVNLQEKQISNMATHGKTIYSAGRISDFSKDDIIVSAHNLSGEKLWSTTSPIGTRYTRSVDLRVVGPHLVLAVATTSSSEQMDKTVHVYRFTYTLDGAPVSQQSFQFDAPEPIHTNNIHILGPDTIVLQGSMVVSSQDGKDILVYRFENGQQTWMTAVGTPGFKTVTSIRKSPNGNLLFVGSRQVQGWAFMLDGNGALLWDLLHGDDSGKNWFHDAAFTQGGIMFAGYTNVTDGSQEKGWIVKASPSGTVNGELQFGAGGHYRIQALEFAHPDELIMTGARIFQNMNRFDSWLFNTDATGKAWD